MNYTVVNLAGFQVGWAFCVIGAGAGLPWAGPLAALVLVLAHLWWIRDRHAEVAVLLPVAGIGVLMDSLLGLSGVFRFAEPWPVDWLAPAWLMALWLLFAATLRHGLDWLLRRPWLACTFGALGGPLAYLAGERLGAAAFPFGYPTTLGVLAICWGLLMLALTRLVPRVTQTLPLPKHGRSSLT